VEARRNRKDLRHKKDLTRLFILVSILIGGGTLGFMAFEGWRLLDAFYMTVITVTTVGFAEVRPMTEVGRMFTIAVVAAGIGTGYVAAGVLGRALLLNLSRRESKRMEKIIRDMEGHVVLCGYGRLGDIVLQELETANRSFVVVEKDPATADELHAMGIPFLQADATEEDSLQRAGVEKAGGVIAAIGSDAGNVFITLTARGLNATCPIVARADHPETERKLRMVGATRVVTPYSLGGKRLAQAFLRPSAVDLADLAIGGDEGDFLIEEVELPEGMAAETLSLKGLDLGARFGLIAVAVRHASDQALHFRPRAETPLRPGDHLLVMGKKKGLDGFQEILEDASS